MDPVREFCRIRQMSSAAQRVLKAIICILGMTSFVAQCISARCNDKFSFFHGKVQTEVLQEVQLSSRGKSKQPIGNKRLAHFSFLSSDSVKILSKTHYSVKSEFEGATNPDALSSDQLLKNSGTVLESIICGENLSEFLCDLLYDLLGSQEDIDINAVSGNTIAASKRVAIVAALTRGKGQHVGLTKLAPDAHVLHGGDLGYTLQPPFDDALGWPMPAGSFLLTHGVIGNSESKASGNRPRAGAAQSGAIGRVIAAKLSSALHMTLDSGGTNMLDLHAQVQQTTIDDRYWGYFVDRSPTTGISNRSEERFAKESTKRDVWHALKSLAPEAELKGACMRGWLDALLPPDAFHPPFAPSNTNGSSRPPFLGALVALLRSESAGQALSRAPWASLSLRILVAQRESNNSAHRSDHLSAQSQRQEFTVQVKVGLSLVLLPKHLQSHQELLDAAESLQQWKPGPERVYRSASANESIAHDTPDASNETDQSSFKSVERQESALASDATTACAPYDMQPQQNLSWTPRGPAVQLDREVVASSAIVLTSRIRITIHAPSRSTEILAVGNGPENLSKMSCESSSGVNSEGKEDLVLVTVTEPFPTYAMPLLHTYYLHAQPKLDQDFNETHRTRKHDDNVCEAVHIPSLPSFHITGETLVWTYAMSPRCAYHTHLQLHQLLLPRDSHPADASRGRYYPPSFVSTRYCRSFGSACGSTQTETGPEVFYVTDSNLVRTPIPDFSMPFNVLTLATTVVAFLVGSLTNALFDVKVAEMKTRNETQ